MALNVRKKIQGLWQQFSYHQQRQLLLAFLVIFSVSSFILAFMQFRYRINSPLSYFKKVDSANFNQPLDEEEEQIAEIQKAQSVDTDEDGLSDYDERYVYSTSPYIPDTDSDGFSDKQEIDSGHNPNCPAGAPCLGGAGSTSSGLDSEILANPADLRVALMNYGFSEQEVKAMTDEQLRVQYITIVSSGATNVPAPSTADQLRSAILQAGIVDEQTLNSLTDDELLKIYNESVGPSQ